MLKVIGIVLLVLSGALGNMAYVEYRIANYGGDMVNNSVVGSLIKVKAEIPTETYLYGVGGLFLLGLGIALVIRK